MALPQTFDPTSPADSDSPAEGAAHLRDHIQKFIDCFGMPAAPASQSTLAYAPVFSFDAADENVTVGTGATFPATGAKILGIMVGTTPTAQPADVVQLWSIDHFGAGSAGLMIRDELGNELRFGDIASGGSGGFKLVSSVAAGSLTCYCAIAEAGRMITGTETNHPLDIFVANSHWHRFDQNANFGLHTGGSTFGGSAVGVLGHGLGTAPTSAPADMVQRWVADRNGAGTATPRIWTEDVGTPEGNLTFAIQSFDGTERTVTNVAANLSTHTTNVPLIDGVLVTGRYRKTAGAAATASLGLKLNGTQVIIDTPVTTAVNQAEDGLFAFGTGVGFGLRPGLTNYTHAGFAGQATATPSLGGTQVAYNIFGFGAAIPSAILTSVIVTGVTGNAAVTLAILDVTVYRIASV